MHDILVLMKVGLVVMDEDPEDHREPHRRHPRRLGELTTLKTLFILNGRWFGHRETSVLATAERPTTGAPDR